METRNPSNTIKNYDFFTKFIPNQRLMVKSKQTKKHCNRKLVAKMFNQKICIKNALKKGIP